MDLDQAAALLNASLTRHKPKRFSSSWISRHTPRVYRFVKLHVRRDDGPIDWDSVTAKLDRAFPKRWHPRRRKTVVPYADDAEVHLILQKYAAKLYVFLSPLDEADKRLGDTISIALVRLAQKGNARAQDELLGLLRYTVDDWIERKPNLRKWVGYRPELEEQLQACIRRYRFTGSFLGYVFKTLLYAGRGLRPLTAASLDAPYSDSHKTRLENVVQDQETGTIALFAADRWSSAESG
jgi:hypothetical protein